MPICRRSSWQASVQYFIAKIHKPKSEQISVIKLQAAYAVPAFKSFLYASSTLSWLASMNCLIAMSKKTFTIAKEKIPIVNATKSQMLGPFAWYLVTATKISTINRIDVGRSKTITVLLVK